MIRSLNDRVRLPEPPVMSYRPLVALALAMTLTACGAGSDGTSAEALAKAGNGYGHCEDNGNGHDKDKGARKGHDKHDGNCGGNGGGNGNDGSAEIKVLSNRADLISDGNALVEVVLSQGAEFGDLSVTLNGTDVTSQFALRPNDRVMAQLSGLALGNNQLSALVGGVATHTVSITNYPNGGPLFAGPQPEPWTCNNNGVAIDDDCNQPAEYKFFYKSTDPNQPGLSDYDPENPPDDVAMTTTQNGQTVPFIVRREKGYQLRDQYYIFQLFDPSQAWEPWAPQPTWNQKLLITHGGSCGTTHRPGTPPLDDYAGTIPPNPAIEQSYVAALGLGFAVGSTALDNLGHNCNLVTAAESLIMMKERLVEEYGELRYTLGSGCSGGSITQQQIANSYPGVYQGLITTCSYPDVIGTAIQFAEYHILRNYFEDFQPSTLWTPTQWADVIGHVSYVNAVAADEAFFKSATDPSNCKGADASADAYNATSNPSGVRCGVVDYLINLFGPRRPDVWTPNEVLLGRGFGGLPVDNVGVQYGLRALQQGKISSQQFIDLNQNVGAVDIDINPIPERLVGDPDALNRVYRTGAINIGTHMDKVPIIDGRGPDPAIAHDAVHVYMMRARLDREHGHHDNHVIWEGPAALIGDPYFLLNGLEAMDRWATEIEADPSNKPLAQKVVDNKPADIGDACYNGSGVKLTDGICGEAVVPTYGTPRIVAGEGTAEGLVGNKGIPADTAKCQLMPLDSLDPTPALGDYGPLGLTAAQWATMHEIFPDGVCDFSKPGVGYTDAVAWLTYQEDNGDVIYGGTPMPPAPDYSGGGVASPAFDLFK